MLLPAHVPHAPPLSFRTMYLDTFHPRVSSMQRLTIDRQVSGPLALSFRWHGSQFALDDVRVDIPEIAADAAVSIMICTL